MKYYVPDHLRADRLPGQRVPGPLLAQRLLGRLSAFGADLELLELQVDAVLTLVLALHVDHVLSVNQWQRLLPEPLNLQLEAMGWPVTADAASVLPAWSFLLAACGLHQGELVVALVDTLPNSMISVDVLAFMPVVHRVKEPRLMHLIGVAQARHDLGIPASDWVSSADAVGESEMPDAVWRPAVCRPASPTGEGGDSAGSEAVRPGVCRRLPAQDRVTGILSDGSSERLSLVVPVVQTPYGSPALQLNPLATCWAIEYDTGAYRMPVIRAKIKSFARYAGVIWVVSSNQRRVRMNRILIDHAYVVMAVFLHSPA